MKNFIGEEDYSAFSRIEKLSIQELTRERTKFPGLYNRESGASWAGRAM